MALTCTTCGYQLPDPPGRKYIVVFPLPRGGLRIEIGCDHHAVDTTNAVAVFSGALCFEAWMSTVWYRHLAACEHPEPAVPEGIHGLC